MERARPASAREFPGPILALVPHADDETLGFGGTLARWTASGTLVALVLVTDGTGSHPMARAHDAERRREVREAEFDSALQQLGATGARVEFWRKPDTRLPHLDGAARAACVEAFAKTLRDVGARTVLTPWRRDPHGDHRAITSWVLEHLAAVSPDERPLLAEYCVWLGHQGSAADFAGAEQLELVAVDVAQQRARKRAALAAHRSQLGGIFDDPDGFTIPASLAGTVERTHEFFLLTHPRR